MGLTFVDAVLCLVLLAFDSRICLYIGVFPSTFQEPTSFLEQFETKKKLRSVSCVPDWRTCPNIWVRPERCNGFDKRFDELELRLRDLSPTDSRRIIAAMQDMERRTLENIRKFDSIGGVVRQAQVLAHFRDHSRGRCD